MSVVLPVGRRNPIREIARIRDYDFAAIAVQQRPQIRKTYWDLGNGGNSRYLAFPHTIFIAGFYDLEIDLLNFYVYYSNKPVLAKSSMLYYSNLCNVFEDSHVCLGRDAEVKHHLTMQGQIKSVIKSFWTTWFTDHLQSNFFIPGQKLHPDLASLHKWEKASRRHRDFIVTVDWRKAYSLRTGMERAIDF